MRREMTMRRLAGLMALALVTGACATTPESLEETMLTPGPATSGERLTTFNERVPHLDVDSSEVDMEALSRTVVLGGRKGDSVVATLSLWEYEPMLYLDVWLYNMSTQDVTVGPSMAQLVDASHTQFRRLEPHRAAQIYASQIRGVPPY
jgi:hypothetical protein